MSYLNKTFIKFESIEKTFHFSSNNLKILKVKIVMILLI